METTKLLTFYSSDIKCICGTLKCDLREQHFQEFHKLNPGPIFDPTTNFHDFCIICRTEKSTMAILCASCFETIKIPHFDTDSNIQIQKEFHIEIDKINVFINKYRRPTK